MPRKALSLQVVHLVVVLAIPAAGCAPAAGDDDVAVDSGELRALRDTEVVGELYPNGQYEEADLPEVTTGRNEYRAFRFYALDGDRLLASVIAPESDPESDPIAYVLGDDFKTLMRNDDWSPDTKDSVIKFRARRTGYYYLAFRNKNRQAGTFYATLEFDHDAQAPWTSKWPASTNPEYYVELETKLGASAVVAASSCNPADVVPAEPSATSTTHTLGCTVHRDNAQITCTFSNLTTPVRTTEILPDGSFEFFEPIFDTGTSDHVAAIGGRIVEGGLVSLRRADVYRCSANQATVTQLRDLLGRLKPR